MYTQLQNEIHSVYTCTKAFADLDEARAYFLKTLPLDLNGRYACNIGISGQSLPALVLFRVKLPTRNDLFTAAGICESRTPSMEPHAKFELHFSPETITFFLQPQTQATLPEELGFKATRGAYGKLDPRGLRPLCAHLDEKVTLLQAVTEQEPPDKPKSILPPLNTIRCVNGELNLQPFMIDCNNDHWLNNDFLSQQMDRILDYYERICTQIRDGSYIMFMLQYPRYNRNNGSSAFVKPRIKFSAEHKTIEYGKYSPATVKRKIRELQRMLQNGDMESKNGTSRSIQQMSSTILDWMEQTMSNDEEGENEGNISRINALIREISGMLHRELDPFTQRLVEEIMDLYNMYTNIHYVSTLFGTYSATENAITLYICTICNHCAEENIDFADKVVSVLAHEMYHAIHFHALLAISDTSKLAMQHWKGKNADDQERKGVIESLARYFEYCWCMESGSETDQETAQEIRKEGYRTVFPAWPYAGAKYLIWRNAYESREFNRIMETSLHDWSDAFKELVR